MFPTLARYGSTIAWQVCSAVTDGETYGRDIAGALITGRSLRVRTEWMSFALTLRGKSGRRESPNHWLNVFHDPFGWPVEGDVAFLALELFHFRPDGPIRELEMEVRGSWYDGAQVQWKQGGGILATPPIVGGDPVFGPTHNRELTGWATFGAVVRKAVGTASRLIVQHLEFTGIVGFVKLVPSRPGALRNVGNIPVLITGAQKGGPQAREFDIRLEYRGEVFQVPDLPGRAPLVLAPGEALVVGGRFFPQAEAGPEDRPRSAFVDFETNHPQTPVVRVDVSGRTEPSQPGGQWLPPQINFGFVPVTTGAPRTRNALLESFGQTPLLVQSLALEDENLGLDWGILQAGPTGEEEGGVGALYQIDSGDAMIIQVRFRPNGVGFVETILVAQTNAGRLELRLLAEGVDA